MSLKYHKISTFYTSWKHQKTSGFLLWFSNVLWDIERWDLHKIFVALQSDIKKCQFCWDWSFQNEACTLVAIWQELTSGDIQLLCYHKMTKIWTSVPHCLQLFDLGNLPPSTNVYNFISTPSPHNHHPFLQIKKIVWIYNFITTCCNQHL